MHSMRSIKVYGQSQVDPLIENINKNSKNDSFDEDMYKNALRTVRNDMNSEMKFHLSVNSCQFFLLFLK